VIRRYASPGLLLRGMENGSLSATVTGNVIEQPDVYYSSGVMMQTGLIGPGTATSCLALTGNSISSSAGSSGVGFDLSQTLATTIRLPGYGGANSDNAAVITYVRANQTGATLTMPTGTASNNVAGGGGGFVGGAACTTPP
jgi:hypothetical protein